MSDKCIACGQTLPDIKAVIENYKDNIMWSWGWEIGSTKTFGGYELTLIAKNEHEEGNYSTQVFFVVEYNGSFYKKTGEEASHSGLYWDAGVKEVFPKEKVVIEYE